jgi:nickel-dependent lactate racemase
MKVRLAYGRGHLELELPGDLTTVIEPSPQPGLADERAALLAALAQPIAAPPLASAISPRKRVCIVHTDITRATPNDRLIPWLLAELENAGAAREKITLLNGTGTHRPNTRAELEAILTPAVVANYRCVNHDCHDRSGHVQFGVTSSGVPALIDRHFAEADVRIVTGFIEPHFFAGFSGGPKGIMPGVAALETVMSNHGSRHIAHPNAAFGITDGNPLWEEMRDIALRVGPAFLINVALNEQREITGVFAGGLVAAHRAGIEFVRASAMQKVRAPFDIVVTTNSGRPLDMNLYQAVKGMAAAARIVKDAGTIILAAECAEGVPAGSPHERLLRSVANGEELLARLAQPGAAAHAEQWQSQIQALIQRRAEVHVHSALPDATIRAAHLLPCRDIGVLISAKLASHSGNTRIAVLPQGPLTIPYLDASSERRDGR